MARIHTGQMALYEAVNQDKFKAAQDKELERVAGPGTLPDPASKQPLNRPAQPDKPAAPWPARPRAVQVNNGRIELFVPFPAAITVGLILLLLLAAVFALGRVSAGGKENTPAAAAVKDEDILASTAAQAKKLAVISTAPIVKPVVQTSAAPAGSGSGAFVIVLKQLSDPRNLEPAKKYFDERGVPTEIKQVSGSYFLITKQRFDTTRSESYAAVLAKIKQLGMAYKSPPGYGSFAPKMFNDAYGRKM